MGVTEMLTKLQQAGWAQNAQAAGETRAKHSAYKRPLLCVKPLSVILVSLVSWGQQEAKGQFQLLG